MPYKLKSTNEKEKELGEHNNLHKWLRELENACAYIGKFSSSQLRAFHKVRHHLNLSNRDRTKTNLDNELQTNLDNKPYNFRNQLQQQLSTVTFTKKKEKLDNYKVDMNFYSAASKTKLQSRLGVQLQLRDADSTLRDQLMRPLQRASTEACQEYSGFSLGASFRSRIDNQLPRTQLDTEETFSKTASKTAAWQKRASDRQLLSQQLGRRELQTGNFSNSSLEEETFRKATSETAAWKTRLSAQQLQREQLGKGTLPSQLGRQQLGNSASNSPAFRQELRELSLRASEKNFYN